MDEKTIRRGGYSTEQHAEVISSLITLLDAEREKAKRGRAHAGRLALIAKQATDYMNEIDEHLFRKPEPTYEDGARYARQKMLEISRTATNMNDNALKVFLADVVADAVSNNISKRDIARFIRERMETNR